MTFLIWILSLASSSFSLAPQPTEYIILPQSPSLSIPPPSSAVSVVSKTHSFYGPWGTVGLCYILPYKQLNHHPQHACIFPSLFSCYVYFYSLKENTFLGSNQRRPKFSRFCGNHNIVFHEANPSSLGNSLRTIWSALLFWSKAVQSERGKSGVKLRLRTLCWQSKKIGSLGPNWTSEPEWVSVYLSMYVCVFW